MISVLIPVCNYNIQPLVEDLISQLDGVDYKWEIFISDDVSDNKYKRQNFNFVSGLRHAQIKLFQQEVNLGNAANRNYLINRASYDWLLFLDADVLSVKNDFILTYAEEMRTTKKSIISGNIIYDNENSLPHLLRWKYGKEKEEITFKKRKEHLILNIRGANFAIKREFALRNLFPLLKEKYGFVDTRFFLQFKPSQVCVIENPVYHLGIEENWVFIEKTKKAIANALFLMNTNDDTAKQITLITSYNKVRVVKKMLAVIYRKFYLSIDKNLNSKNPSLFVFQLFKILYLSSLDVSEDV